MILSPLKSTKNLLGQTVHPVITQKFGARPEYYKRYGHKGHNGIDFRAPVGTPLYAPMDGTVTVRDQGDKDYGLHVIISNQRLSVILAHLSRVDVHTGQVVGMGEPIALSGKSGSVDPHLHLSAYKMNGPVKKDPDNGFGGAFDITPYIVCWDKTL